ncbi:hypothetical protein MMC25_008254 [Agyrium rufum]|nr:hypothetical protein [Agyrium rufum]
MLLRGFIVSAFAVSGSLAASSVLDLIPSNFDNVVLQSGKPALVEFFAPWCGHCKTLAPIYEELAASFISVSDKVSIAKVDADDHKALGKRFGIGGFPTLKWFDGKSETPEDYKGGRDLESLTKFVSDKIGVKPKSKKASPSAVQILTDKSFAEEIGGEKDIIVAFTAPWCGHCKTLAPIWETVAQDFAQESSVVVAKVDAEAENSKATANAQGVTSYPTIKFFSKGSKTPHDYTGGRSEKDLLDFLNTQAGTHRAVGGSLNAKAGTIATLDTLVSKFTQQGNLAAAVEEVKKAATGLADNYADYYVRVIEKLGKSEDYGKKELARLQGIIMKGGLAPEKLDDLVSRSNILRQLTTTHLSKDEL